MAKALNLLSLQVFVEVVRLGSFTAAAQRLDLSQPAVSFHIRTLEDRFGVPLLERTGRTVTPTVAGAELLSHARTVTDALTATNQAMARFGHEPGGTLRIGTGTTFCMAVLPAVIRQVRETLPSLRLEVTTATTPAIVRGLEDDRFDAGIVTVPARSRVVQVTPVLEDEVILLAPKTASLPARLTPEVVARLQPMAFEPLGMTRKLIDDWFANAGVSFQPTVSLGSVEAIRDLVAMDLAPALLSRLALGEASRNQATKASSLTPPLRRTLGIATRTDRPHGAALDAFEAAVRTASAIVASPEGRGGSSM